MKQNNVSRIARLQSKMDSLELDAILIYRTTDMRYFSGFTGLSGMMIITGNDAFLLTDALHFDQAVKETEEGTVKPVQYDDQDKRLHEILNENKIRKAGFEADSISFESYNNLSELLKNIELVSIKPAIDRIRAIKDAEELALLRKAVKIAEDAFLATLPKVEPGVTEREIAAFLEYKMKMLGASGASFPTIVASGPRSALPHGIASDRRLRNGDLITFDFGCVYEGYCSDMTRTVVLGPSDSEVEHLYSVVLKSQLAGIRAVKAGVSGKETDEASRRVIEEAGLGDRFVHGTGHGVGMDVHEWPSISKRNEAPLEPGMVITIEPGVYLTDKVGVRIEDMVLVEDEGCEVLTSLEKMDLLHL